MDCFGEFATSDSLGETFTWKAETKRGHPRRGLEDDFLTELDVSLKIDAVY